MTRTTETPPLPSPGPEEHLTHGALSEQIRILSGGAVRGVRASGPVFGSAVRRRATGEQPFADIALAPRARRTLAWLSAGWLLTLLCFWWWWFQPENRVSITGFVINTLLIYYATCLPTYFVLASNRMRRISPWVGVPAVRAAMVVTKAPSEPWPVVQTTLTAMLHQDYPNPYDVWLADERPDEVTRQWCARHGVQISTRQHDPRYQRAEWPRRQKCKEGNLAYFYDHHGYDRYDVVAQLDADHVPESEYLREMVRPFTDPAVGYVGAPSICDANSTTSWTVRGRLHEEALFHGAQQMGALIQGTPSCIGSHYAVRTAALREIGGIGPELAEDFSTSYLMNVAGWRGAFAIEADAHGDGPRTFEAMATQEFQWARSLTNLLFGVVPRTLRRLSFLRALEFTFRCGFDVLIALITVSGIALFAVSCATGVPFVSVNLVVFLGFMLTLTAWLIGMKALMRSQGLCRPCKAPLMSWEGVLYLYTRWPFIVMGVAAALADKVFRRPVHFKVTPKGDGGPESLMLRRMMPFIVIALLLAACAMAGVPHAAVVGYVGLALLAACVNVALVFAVSLLHARDARVVFSLDRGAALALVRPPLVAALVAALPIGIVISLYVPQLTKVVLS